MSRSESRTTIEAIVRNALRHQTSVVEDPAREVELVFGSDFSLALKHETVEAGRTLWQRQYVEGNGGNISCRLTDDWVLCTPTLMSVAT